ncbi:hypothetical protein L1049_005701 [Liquidambar formosana]|uniref:Uncharacterized protein n=1 Tax=Liquidambar formosana TaxID=63359 RepID=A0AAP0RFT5_LIQFO
MWAPYRVAIQRRPTQLRLLIYYSMAQLCPLLFIHPHDRIDGGFKSSGALNYCPNSVSYLIWVFGNALFLFSNCVCVYERELLRERTAFWKNLWKFDGQTHVSMGENCFLGKKLVENSTVL